MEIRIPKMERWEQISGDMNPGAHGGIIARSDGDALELVEIQPVVEYVGEDEAREVGFPFWSKEGYYYADDLQLDRTDVQNALRTVDVSDDDLRDMPPTARALTIAEALMAYGAGSEEGPAGWANDVVHGEVKWATGEVAGPEFLSDEEDDFRRDVLGEDDDEDEDDEQIRNPVHGRRAPGAIRVEDEGRDGWRIASGALTLGRAPSRRLADMVARAFRQALREIPGSLPVHTEVVERVRELLGPDLSDLVS